MKTKNAVCAITLLGIQLLASLSAFAQTPPVTVGDLNTAVKSLKKSVDDTQSQLLTTSDNLSSARTEIAELQSTVKDLHAEADQIKAMLTTVVARTEASAATARYSTPDGKTKALEDAKASAALIPSAPAVPMTDAAQGADLKAKIESCLSDTRKIAAKIAAGASQDEVLSSCPDREKILQEIEQRRTAIEHDWETCRNDLTGSGLVNPDALPADIRDISPETADATEKNLTALISTGKDRVQSCADKLKKDVENMKSIDASQALLAAMMTFLAQACFASGNVYACGAMVLLAVLTDMGKGGGGESGGGTTAHTQGDAHGDGKGKYSVPTKDTDVSPDPTGRSGPAGVANSFGTSPDGDVICDSRIAGRITLTCFEKAAPSKKIVLDSAELEDSGTQEDNTNGAEEFSTIIKANEPQRFALCTAHDPSRFVNGIVLLTGPNVRSAALVYTAQGGTKLKFGSPQAKGPTDPQGWCAKVFGGAPKK